MNNLELNQFFICLSCQFQTIFTLIDPVEEEMLFFRAKNADPNSNLASTVCNVLNTISNCFDTKINYINTHGYQLNTVRYNKNTICDNLNTE